ncbi:MAG: hypothetical protein ACYTGL_13860 [Planctomycetota bacterium]|jgi:hypothetical protein
MLVKFTDAVDGRCHAINPDFVVSLRDIEPHETLANICDDRDVIEISLSTGVVIYAVGECSAAADELNDLDDAED